MWGFSLGRGYNVTTAVEWFFYHWILGIVGTEWAEERQSNNIEIKADESVNKHRVDGY